MSALDKLALAEMQEAEEAREGFRVTDKGSADWCLRKIAAYEVEMEENRKFVEEEKLRLDMWLEKENEQAMRSIDYFGGLLREWMEEEYGKNPRKRSISLPHGRIRLRQQQPEYAYRDEEVLAFLKENAPDLIQTVETYNKSNIKAFIKKHCEITPDGVPVMATTGEIMPGVKVTERGLRFEFQTEGK
jgi:hypothetical protein